MASLTLEDIQKSYGSVEILKGIDLNLPSGSFLVLLGPSGCGKSTLLNMIAGLEDITEGDIRIGGEVVNNIAPKDRDIAMVFQSYALYPNMTVYDNIAFGLKMRKVDRETIHKLVSEASEMLQLTPLLKRKPAALSGGQRQRVAMGRALVRRPKVYLFDEPLSNLDAKLRGEMRAEIKKLHQNLGTTIVYVTHDQIEAMTLASHVAVMNGGVVQQFASPQEIYDNPANMFVAGFVGSPSMNFIPAKILVESDFVYVDFTLKNKQGRLRLVDAMAVKMRSEQGRSVILGIRPESLNDSQTKLNSGKEKYQPLTVVADFVEPTGPDTLVHFEMGGIASIARIRPHTKAFAGEEITLTANLSKACLFDPETEERLC